MMVVLGGLIVTTSVSFGKAEYTKKEKKACTYCHTANGKKDLNDVGKCYAERIIYVCSLDCLVSSYARSDFASGG